MTEAQTSPDESFRLKRLNELAILDTGAEPAFDSLVRVAAHIAGCAIAMINFVDADRVWVKAVHGCSVSQMDRQASFCNEAIKQSDPLVVSEADRDELALHNWSVAGGEPVAFYAGFPLEHSGQRVGTLCVLNPLPITLSDEQLSALSDLAISVCQLLANRRYKQQTQSRHDLLSKLSREVPGFIYQFQLHPDNSISFPFATNAVGTIYDVEIQEAQVDARKALDWIHPNDRDEFMESMHESARKLETWRKEYRVVIPDVGVRWREGHSTPERLADGSTLWHGYVSDITDRKAIELDALRSREQASLATRAASVSIIRWDIDKRLVTLDHLARQHFAVTSSDATIAQDDWLARLRPADKLRCELLMTNAVRDNEALALEFQVLGTDGIARDVVLHIGAQYGENPESVEIICASRDVTASREAERQQRIADAAQQANAEKGRFLARVSHELRTPLNAIYGLSQVLAGDPKIQADATCHERTGQIVTASEHLIRLIDDLLELTKTEADESEIKLETVSVDECVGRSLALARHLARDDQVHIQEPIPQTGQFVYANKRRLEQCLINLLGNALKYNRSGGSVGVSVETADGLCRIHINDTGPGLSAEQLGQVFEPFNRTGAEFSSIPGSGLGLSISKHLVEQMGGKLSANSIVGVGSQFTLSLRSAALDQLAPKPERWSKVDWEAEQAIVSSAGVGEKVRTVLYVEDNALNRAVMQGFLDQQSEVNLLLAESGKACLEILEDCVPDLLLVDIHLPDMNGKDLLAMVRTTERLANLPAIAVSADALPDDIAAARQIGFMDYWIKPLKLAQVRAALGVNA